ncbi:thiol-disulfide oxidoreductase DCC family protein [Phaeobacter sp.]|uniref:thiol-disulfide oxidoreductase DCC family protein n=1 Tax=Phaeobacter sp. TaxID=1902409 RepID=UPI0025FD8793|nr:DUF393 domain-containing protein [Phaeobacter sp.]
MSVNKPSADAREVDVLFNGDCPVCSLEINHYVRISQRRDLPMRFDDLNACDLQRWGVDADQAAKRLHVRQGDTVYAGIPAFLILWAQMPGYRWLGRVVGLPGIRQLSCVVYDRILAPALYRWHLMRQRRNAKRKA